MHQDHPGFGQAIARHAEAAFADHQRSIFERTNSLFARLLIIEWLCAIAAACWISPRTWSGATSQVHLHVWAALLLGGTIITVPVLLALTRPGMTITRHSVAAAQMLMSALLIHLTGGRIETHFHVFGSLAFLAFYRDWRVLVSATVLVAADHFLRGLYWPRSVYGIVTADPTRWLEHAGWVAFEDIILVLSCRQGVREMRLIAERQARLEATNDLVNKKSVELKSSEEQYRDLFENTSNLIQSLGPDGRFLYVNRAWRETLGYTDDEIAHLCVADIIHPDNRAHYQRVIERVRSGENVEEAEAAFLTRDGRRITVAGNMNAKFVDGRLVSLRGIFRDITERKTFEEQLSHQAFHDSLSGLPNRAHFRNSLARALAHAQRQNSRAAVLFLDLDNFKIINDSLGHQAGDQLLIALAQHYQACVRPGDTVARLGGDEFTILMEDVKSTEDVVRVAERIAQHLRTPICLQGREVFVSASIGIAISGGDDDVDGLLRDADTAMYQAKMNGKAQYVVFDHSMNIRALERLELEADLRRALDRGELRLHYQPIVLLDTGKINEVEALVRWEHPQRGLISPAKFIPIAEETGLIVPLGRWVLGEACRQAQMWESQAPQDPPLVMSVNLSARQLQEPDLVEDVGQILLQTGLNPSRLKLEITESVMMQDAESTITKLHQLRQLGIQLAMDDFGTGYSSMAYLSTLPIDALKIDRSFISQLGEDADYSAIVQAIISMAKTLNLQVTSEGIESEEQLAQLRELGSDRGQGYYFARPLTGAAATLLLRSDLLPISNSKDALVDAPTTPPEQRRLAA